MTSVSTVASRGALRSGNRRRDAADAPSSASSEAPVFRLRYLLLLAILAGLVATLWPRGRAAWRLHNMATALADYSLCMVGPTGPALVRESPASLLPLLRLRLIAATPEERPFQECSRFFDQVPMSSVGMRAHGASARTFEEYLTGPGADAEYSLSQMLVDGSVLEELARDAWPFVRTGPKRLIAASSHAREAIHPAAPPRPGTGSGLLPGPFQYRSTAAFGDRIVAALGSGANTRTLVSDDGGVNWRSGGRRLAADITDRCIADHEGRAYTLTVNAVDSRVVISHGPGAAPQIATLASVERRVVGIACDQSALVAVLTDEADADGRRPVTIRLCPFRRPCQDMEVQATGQGELYYPVDVARLDGDTVITRTHGGLTRVATTRDDGKSWSPWHVVYDGVATAAEADDAPFRLLVAGERVLLYTGAATRDTPYPLLVSEDHGASFHAPEALAPARQ